MPEKGTVEYRERGKRGEEDEDMNKNRKGQKACQGRAGTTALSLTLRL